MPTPIAEDPKMDRAVIAFAIVGLIVVVVAVAAWALWMIPVAQASYDSRPFQSSGDPKS